MRTVDGKFCAIFALFILTGTAGGQDEGDGGGGGAARNTVSYLGCSERNTVSVFSWDLLAPIWANSLKYNAALVDRRLFNEQKRYATIVRTLQNTEADILSLQEVQFSWFQPLVNVMRAEGYDYSLYGTHAINYWRQHLPTHDGRVYQRHGNAIFYRANKFVELDRRSTQTTIEGNVISLATFRLSGDFTRASPTFIVVNGMMEVGLLNYRIRISQISLVEQEIMNVKRGMRSRFRLLHDPIVIWAANLNTIEGLPTYSQMVGNGYSNVFEVMGIPQPDNYFGVIGYPHSSGYIFVEQAPVSNQRIRVLDSKVDELNGKTEGQKAADRNESVEYFITLLEAALALNRTQVVDQMGGLLHQLTYDAKLNYALRAGSDHVYQETLFCFP